MALLCMKINISFNLNGNIIKTEDEVKLLGVTIDNLWIKNLILTSQISVEKVLGNLMY